MLLRNNKKPEKQLNYTHKQTRSSKSSEATINVLEILTSTACCLALNFMLSFPTLRLVQPIRPLRCANKNGQRLFYLDPSRTGTCMGVSYQSIIRYDLLGARLITSRKKKNRPGRHAGLGSEQVRRYMYWCECMHVCTYAKIHHGLVTYQATFTFHALSGIYYRYHESLPYIPYLGSDDVGGGNAQRSSHECGVFLLSTCESFYSVCRFVQRSRGDLHVAFGRCFSWMLLNLQAGRTVVRMSGLLRAFKRCFYVSARRPGLWNQCAIWGDPGERYGGIKIEIEIRIGFWWTLKADLPMEKERSSDPIRPPSSTFYSIENIPATRRLACLSSSHAIKCPRFPPPHPITLKTRMLTASNRGARLHHPATEVEMIGNCGRIHMRKRIREYRHM